MDNPAQGDNLLLITVLIIIAFLHLYTIVKIGKSFTNIEGKLDKYLNKKKTTDGQRRSAEDWLFENNYADNQYVIRGYNLPFGVKSEEISLTEVLTQFAKTFNATDEWNRQQ